MVRTAFRRAARTFGGATAVVGGLVLLGWAGGFETLKSVWPGLSTMKVNTAVAFVLLGLSLAFQTSPEDDQFRRFARGLALVGAAIGSLTLTEYGLHIRLGINDTFWTPGGMAPGTALCIALLGACLLLLDTQRRLVGVAADILAAVALFIGSLAVCGYVFGVPSLHHIAGYNSIAIHTAVTVCILSFGVFAARPDRGITAFVTQDNAAGVSIRRLLPLIGVTPFVLGFVRLQAQRHGLFGTEFGLAFMVVSCTTVLIGLAIWNARIQGRTEAERQVTLRDERFLSEIGDCLRESFAADDALRRVSQLLGAYFDASRCFLGGVLLAEGRLVVREDYTGDGQVSVAGSHELTRFSAIGRADGEHGRTIICEDAKTDPRTAIHFATSYAPLGVHSYVMVPLRRNGVWVSALLLGCNRPRRWRKREITILESVAERTWAWVEHLNAIHAMRTHELDLAVTMDSMGEGLIATDEAGRIVRMNPVAEALTGWSAADATGQNVSAVFCVAESERAVSRVLGEDESRGLPRQTTLVARDGVQRPVVVHASPKRDSAGASSGVVLVFRDATAELATAHALTTSEARFRALIDASAQIVWSTGPNGEVLEDSSSWRSFTGQQYEQWIGPERQEVIHPMDRERTISDWEIALKAGQMLESEARIRHVSGQWRWTTIRAVPLRGPDGSIREWVGMNSDITERKQAELERESVVEQLAAINDALEERVNARTAQLSRAIAERDVLLQEVHHRVKNNLQVVSSLINMQLRRVTDAAARAALSECKARVASMGLIHEKLYQAKDYSQIAFKDYAVPLARSIFDASGLLASTIDLSIQIDDVSLSVDRAIPCGLLLNELISNALKHAFPSERKGSLLVELSRIDDKLLRLVVRDDGVGIAKQSEISRSATLGLQIVTTLVAQIDGTMEMDGNDGTTVAIVFPREAS